MAGSGDGRSELFDKALVERLTGDPRCRARTWLMDAVTQHLARADCRIVLLTGAPGTGKSTVMGYLAAQHPHWPRYFIRRAGETESDAYTRAGGVTSFLTQTGFQLLDQWGEELFPRQETGLEPEVVVSEIGPDADITVLRVAQWFTSPFRQQAIRATLEADRVYGRATVLEIGQLADAASQDPDQLAEDALIEPLRRLAARYPGERVVVLLDGLDEVRFRDRSIDVARWLADHGELPANLRIVVASRPDNPLLSAIRLAHKTSVREVRISPAEHPQDVTRDVDGYLRGLANEATLSPVLHEHGLTAEQFVGEVSLRAEGNFLYLAMIARLLDAEAAALGPGPAVMRPVPDLDWVDFVRTLPHELPDFYALLLLKVLNSVGGTPATRSHWAELYRPLLGVLAVTMSPLTARQLRAFAGIAYDPPAVDAALGRISFFLDRFEGDQGPSFRLHHTAMADFLTGTDPAQPDPLLYCDPRVWHGHIVGYATRTHQQTGTWLDADRYLRQRLPWHAAEAGRLDDLLDDPAYLIAADPDALVPELAAADDRGAPIASVYQQVVPLLRDGMPASALAHLKLYAEQQGLAEFAARIPADSPGSPFRLGFTRWEGVRLREVLGRHDGEVTGVAVTQGLDRRPLAVTGGHDGRIRIWDLLAGREAAASPVSTRQAITALAAGALDGAAVAVSGDFGGAVRVWDLVSGQQVGPPMIGPENSGQAIAAAFTSHGPQAVCRIGDQFQAWDLTMLTPVHSAFSPGDVEQDGPLAAAERNGSTALALTLSDSESGGRGRVRVWDTAIGEPLGPVIETGRAWVTALALAEVDRRLLVAIADLDLAIQVFDVATGQPRTERRVFFESPSASALALGVVNGRAVIAVGDVRGQVLFREMSSLRRLGDAVQAHAGCVTALGFGPAADHPWLTSVGREPPDLDGQWRAAARFWRPDPVRPGRFRLRASAGGELVSYQLTQVAAPISLREPADSIVLGRVADCQTALMVGGRSITRWDVASGQAVGETFGGRSERVSAVGVATIAGRTVALSALYGTGIVRTWDLPEGKPRLHPVTGQPLVRHDLETVRGLAVTRLGGQAVAVCASWDEVCLWDVATGEPAGAGRITGMRNIQSLSVGELNGRPVVACVAGADRDGPALFDLETGRPVEPPPASSARQALTTVAITARAGQTVVVSGSYLSVRAWDPLSAADPTEIRVAGETLVLAATFVRGSPVAVCSGRMGEVRLVDLAAGRGPQARRQPATRPVWPVHGLAVSDAAGRRVVVCAHDNGVHVLDLLTGEDAPAQPRAQLGNTLAVATGTLGGRPVAVAGGFPNHAWFLDTGDPLADQPGWPDTVHSVAVADVSGHAIALGGPRSGGIVVADLATGRPVGNPVKLPGGQVRHIAVVTVAGRPVVLGQTDMTIQARYLDLPWLPPRAAEPGYDEFTRQDDTPQPPALFPSKRLTRHPHGGGWCMAPGAVDGRQIVVSGHDRGDIDVFEVASGLPLQPSLDCGESNLAALDCRPLGGRAVVACGALDGRVLIADLTDLSVQTFIRTLAPVWAVALAEPDHCIVGTDKGVAAIRLPFRPQAGESAGTRGVRLPVDIRAARACPEHHEHRQEAEHSQPSGPRLCLKGVQQNGVRRAGSLSYPGGHCYLRPDRLEIVAAGPSEEKAPPLVIDLRRHHAEPVDDWEAYRTNGCHFGVSVESGGQYALLACYRRSERDWLLAEMKKRLGRE